ASRVIAMIEKYRGGSVPTAARDAAIVELEKSVTDAAHAAIGRLAIHEALAEVEKLVDALNGYVTEQAPWVLAEDPAPAQRLAEVEKLVDALTGYVTEQAPWVLAKDPAQAQRLDEVLATLHHGVGTLAILYSPVMPKATAKLWAALGESGSLEEQRVDRAWDRPGGGTVSALEPLFPRIELETA